MLVKRSEETFKVWERRCISLSGEPECPSIIAEWDQYYGAFSRGRSCVGSLCLDGIFSW